MSLSPSLLGSFFHYGCEKQIFLSIRRRAEGRRSAVGDEESRAHMQRGLRWEDSIRELFSCVPRVRHRPWLVEPAAHILEHRHSNNLFGAAFRFVDVVRIAGDGNSAAVVAVTRERLAAAVSGHEPIVLYQVRSDAGDKSTARWLTARRSRTLIAATCERRTRPRSGSGPPSRTTSSYSRRAAGSRPGS